MAVQFPPTNPPGHGSVHLSANPSQFRTLSYAYPLKLISPAPHHFDSRVVQTLFLLSYGGGLVAGDSITLIITLEPATNLVLLTQGSTKIFNTSDPNKLTTQSLSIKIQAGASLCYIPDPVQPFAKSAFTQRQKFNLDNEASLCICDWVTSGRPARGEVWGFWMYESRNEVWANERLLVRDNLMLDDATTEPFHGGKMDNLGVYGTLIVRGPVFTALAEFFSIEYTTMPRIGEKIWDDETDTEKPTPRELWRKQRLNQEKQNGVLWTASQVRGCTVIKFGSRDVEGSRRWLRSMIVEEGTVEEYFGEKAILCLR